MQIFAKLPQHVEFDPGEIDAAFHGTFFVDDRGTRRTDQIPLDFAIDIEFTTKDENVPHNRFISLDGAGIAIQCGTGSDHPDGQYQKQNQQPHAKNTGYVHHGFISQRTF
jgi:hypothetical protein